MGEYFMIYLNKRISMRLAEKNLQQAKRRTKELIKIRNSPISLSQYIRELISIDSDKNIIN